MLARPDMDALPMEENRTSLFSAVKGIMHAAAMMFTPHAHGASLVLQRSGMKFPGCQVHFQPAEENNPTGGAPGMIAEGVLKNLDVHQSFRNHVWPSLKTGTVGTGRTLWELRPLFPHSSGERGSWV